MPKKVYIDQDECIGCGLCTELCPLVFKMNDDGKAEVIEGYQEEEKIEEAIDGCPVTCIHRQE